MSDSIDAANLRQMSRQGFTYSSMTQVQIDLNNQMQFSKMVTATMPLKYIGVFRKRNGCILEKLQYGKRYMNHQATF